MGEAGRAATGNRADAVRGAEGAAGDAEGPVRQNHVFVGIVLLAAGISVALIQYKVPTIMTALMGLYGLDAQGASWLMSIFTLMGIFCAIPAGALAQRFGAKRMMIVASGIAVAGSVMGLFASSGALLIASRAVEGVALTVLTTCGPLVVERCVRPERIGSAMGIWGIWGCLGSTIAAVLTPTVFALTGFAGLWSAYALVAVAAAAVVAVAIKVPAAPGAPIAPAAPAAPAPAARPRYRELCTKNIALFFVGFAIFNICLLAILTFVPTILQMQGFDPTLSGFISTAPMLLSIVASPLFGALSDKTGRRKPLLIASMLVMGPCTFVLYTNTGALLWVAVALMGLVGMGGVGLFLSGYLAILPRPELASIAMGVLVLVQATGQFLGTFLVQALLGPALENWVFAGGVIMALGLAGTAALALCRMK